MHTNWTTLSALMDDLLDAPADARRALVATRTAGDPGLEAAALRFLAGLEAATGGLLATGGQASAAPRPEPLKAGDRLGAWRIEGLLGAGGMGRVYHVSRVDGGFTQEAALKLADAPAGTDAQLFARERQTLADGSPPVFSGVHQ